MIKAVIFDCFGVLVGDGLEIICQELETTDPEARKYIAETIRLSNRGLIDPEESNRRIAEWLGLSLQGWRARINQGEVRNEDALALVRSLRGTHKTALLSNIGKGSLARRFDDAELDELFDVVVPSAEVGMMKPDAEIYTYTADQLGVTPQECVFIDDREGYVDAAKQVGMQAIWFRSAAQTKQELEAILGAPS